MFKIISSEILAKHSFEDILITLSRYYLEVFMVRGFGWQSGLTDLLNVSVTWFGQEKNLVLVNAEQPVNLLKYIRQVNKLQNKLLNKSLTFRSLCHNGLFTPLIHLNLHFRPEKSVWYTWNSSVQTYITIYNLPSQYLHAQS